MARLVVGAFDGGNGDAATPFATRASRPASTRALRRHPPRALGKFCFLAALSGCTSLARQPIGGIRADPDLRATFEAAVREAWSVGRARGIALADDFAARQLAFLDSLPAQMRSSMLNDLVAGNRLEAPWLSGAVARMAANRASPRPSARRCTPQSSRTSTARR
jgi:2-dehydropantoate 2-reductase